MEPPSFDKRGRMQATHQGRTQSLYSWAKEFSVNAATLYARYHRGLRGDDLFAQDHLGSTKGIALTTNVRTPRNTQLAFKFTMSKEPKPKPPRVPTLCQQYHKEAQAWVNLKHRLFNPDCKAYPQYGGAGFTMCEEWLSFEQFLADVGPRPVGHYCLGRLDNSLNYTVANTRWLPRKVTHKNGGMKRIYTAKRVPYQGQSLTFKELSQLSGVSARTIRARYTDGWRELRLTMPTDIHFQSKQSFAHMGRTTTIKELMGETGLSYHTLHNRYHAGDRDEALVRPVRGSKK